jgi:hypothetical protein
MHGTAALMRLSMFVRSTLFYGLVGLLLSLA